MEIKVSTDNASIDASKENYIIIAWVSSRFTRWQKNPYVKLRSKNKKG